MSSRTSRRAVATLALAGLLLTAGCAGFVGSTDGAANEPNARATSPADGGNATPDKTISVGASGSVTAEPDRAVLHVAVQSTADTAEEARRSAAENVSSLRDALADAGIPEDDVTTEHYNIRQTRDSRRHAPEKREDVSTEYRATHGLKIEIADASRAGEIVDVAVEGGATDVRHVEFTLSDETRADLRERALERAMENARSDADVLADAAALTIDGVHSASTGGADVRPYRAQLTETADAGSAGTEIDSGPVTVSVRVDVTYDATG